MGQVVIVNDHENDHENRIAAEVFVEYWLDTDFFFQSIGRTSALCLGLSLVPYSQKCQVFLLTKWLLSLKVSRYNWQVIGARLDHLKSYQGRGGGELSSRMNIFFLTVPLYEFFRPVHEYLLGLLGAHNSFSFNFSCKNLAFFRYFAHLLRPLINSLMVRP